MSLDLPLGSRGGVAIEHNFPVDGEYLIRVTLRKQEYRYARGLGQPHEVDLRLDGARLGTFTVGREWEPGQLPPMGYAGKFEQVYDGNSFPEWERYALNADRGLEIRTTVTGGRHHVGVAFDRRSALPEGILPLPHDRSSYSYGQDEMQDGNPAVSGIEVSGPYDPSGATELPSRSKVFVCQPNGVTDETRCARTMLSTLARRAYRRPASDADIETLLAFYEEGRAEGSFDTGIQAAVERLLVDPEFLFRIETDPEGVSPGSIYRISDLDLASRLSFFLWSSIPDDELLDLAARDQLGDPGVLDQQIGRMLADARSGALVENFAGQWLQLRKLRNAAPDTATYTAFDENLREAMRLETELFLEDELREDRPLVNMLRADYTFVNERLARHYDIPGVYGPHFRRVIYPDETRGGLLGHASLLTITSLCEPHVTGGARDMAAGEYPRDTTATTTAEHPQPAERGRSGRARDDARAAGPAPDERSLRQLPQHDRPARVRPRVLRCHRPLADHERRRHAVRHRRPDRPVGHADRRHRGARAGRAPGRRPDPPGPVRGNGHPEAADLCAGSYARTH